MHVKFVQSFLDWPTEAKTSVFCFKQNKYNARKQENCTHKLKVKTLQSYFLTGKDRERQPRVMSINTKRFSPEHKITKGLFKLDLFCVILNVRSKTNGQEFGNKFWWRERQTEFLTTPLAKLEIVCLSIGQNLYFKTYTNQQHYKNVCLIFRRVNYVIVIYYIIVIQYYSNIIYNSIYYNMLNKNRISNYSVHLKPKQ